MKKQRHLLHRITIAFNFLTVLGITVDISTEDGCSLEIWFSFTGNCYRMLYWL